MLNRSIYKYTISTLILSLTILTILSGAVLSAPFASADTSASVNVSVTVPSVCSLTASPESVSNTIYPGHDDTIGTTNIKAICNDPAGLAVYAVGYTDNTYGNNKLVNAAAGSNLEIRSFVTGSGTPQQSEWNMTINAVSGTYAPTIVSTFEDTANAIPATYTKVAYRNTMTDMGENANGANFTAAFDAYIAENQAAGTYTGKVKFLLVHPSAHSAPEIPEGFDLAFETAGKTKLDDGNGNEYYSMTDMTSSICSLVDINDTGELIDPRDNSVYSVAKLADGKCWMTKSLRINLATANITAENTNNPTTTFVTESADSTKNTANNSTWCTNGDATCTDQILYNTINLGDTTVDSDGHTYDEYGVYYNWYTATAGNGTYSVSTNNTSVSGDICPKGWRLPKGGNKSNEANNEFWNLTVNGIMNGTKPFSYSAYDYPSYQDSGNTEGTDASTGLRSSPNNFLYSGYRSGSSTYYRGSIGGCWSSTVYDASTAYVLSFASNNVYPGTTNQNKYGGNAVRCLAD